MLNECNWLGDSAPRSSRRSRRVESGILCLFGLHWERPSFDGFRWHMRGLHVLNASPMCNPAVSNVFDGTPALMARGLYDLRPLVTHVVPAERAQELFETAVARKDRYLKGAVQFS